MLRSLSRATTQQNEQPDRGKESARMIKLRRVVKDYVESGALHARIGEFVVPTAAETWEGPAVEDGAPEGCCKTRNAHRYDVDCRRRK